MAFKVFVLVSMMLIGLFIVLITIGEITDSPNKHLCDQFANEVSKKYRVRSYEVSIGSLNKTLNDIEKSRKEMFSQFMVMAAKNHDREKVKNKKKRKVVVENDEEIKSNGDHDINEIHRTYNDLNDTEKLPEMIKLNRNDFKTKDSKLITTEYKDESKLKEKIVTGNKVEIEPCITAKEDTIKNNPAAIRSSIDLRKGSSKKLSEDNVESTHTLDLESSEIELYSQEASIKELEMEKVEANKEFEKIRRDIADINDKCKIDKQSMKADNNGKSNSDSFIYEESKRVSSNGQVDAMKDESSIKSREAGSNTNIKEIGSKSDNKNVFEEQEQRKDEVIVLERNTKEEHKVDSEEAHSVSNNESETSEKQNEQLNPSANNDIIKSNSNSSPSKSCDYDSKEYMCKSEVTSQMQDTDIPSNSEMCTKKTKTQLEYAQDTTKPYYYQQRGFDYRDQYRRYQNFAYGKHFKKPTVKYNYRQPQTIYQKKVKIAPTDEQKDTKSFADAMKIAIAESDVDEKSIHDESGSEKTTPLNTSQYQRKVSLTETNLDMNKEADKEEIEKEKFSYEKKKSFKEGDDEIRSTKNEESRKGLGGILLETEDEDTNEFYNCFSSYELKLPVPFKSEEIHKVEEKEKEVNKITLLEAFKSANSLLGDRTSFAKPTPALNTLSPLSELRDDSVEYKPVQELRFINRHNKHGSSK